jgi:Divergent InlB B-repeat domain
MGTSLSSKRYKFVLRVSVFLVVVVMMAGVVGCGGESYTLTITSTAGGTVTTPEDGTFPYDQGKVVSLVATPDTSYQFANWTGDVGTVANVSAASTTIKMSGNYSIIANFEIKGGQNHSQPWTP